VTRLLFDLNVVLDVLFDRRPHVEAAAGLWAAVERGDVEGVIAAHGVTTLHYLAARTMTEVFARRCVSDVLTVFAVAPVDAAVLRDALSLEFSDFEDAVCAAAASATGCQAIVTRDRRGFKKARVPALTPAEALAIVLA
jgi:predicted nucleic acid-binding protein